MIFHRSSSTSSPTITSDFSEHTPKLTQLVEKFVPKNMRNGWPACGIEAVANHQAVRR